MPFRNEHACRVRSPDRFQADFRRRNSELDGRPLGMIFGRLRSEESLTLQAYRYPAREAGIPDGWSEAEAREHCSRHDGLLFEPADPEARESQQAGLAYEPATRLRAPAARRAAIQVDREAGRLLAVSVAEAGPAIGHGFDLDEKSIEQIVELGNARPGGVKARFTHPDMCHDGLGTELGRARNFRLTEDRQRALADVDLLDAAVHSPDGDLRSWLLEIAQEAPDQLALSVHMRGERKKRVDPATGEPKRGADGKELPPVFRLEALLGVDFVDVPAANRRGLFGTTELAARAAEVLDAALADREPAQALREPDYVRLAAGFDGLTSAEPAVTAGGVTVQLSQEDALLRVSLWINRYLDRRGVWHEPVDPALLRRVFSTLRGTSMKDDTRPIDPTNQPQPSPQPQPPDDAAVRRAVHDENRRQREIRALERLFPDYDLNQVVDSCCEDPTCTVERARSRILEQIAEAQRNPERVVAPVSVGRTAQEKFAAAAADAVCLRNGVIPAGDGQAPAIRATGLANLGPKQLARECLRLAGVRGVDRMSDDQLFRLSMGAPRLVAVHDAGDSVGLQVYGHSSGDFPLILANSANKALIRGYETAGVTWTLWVLIGNLNDFKTHDRLRLSEPALLKERPENMPAEQSTFSEKREQITLKNYASGFSYSRQMFVNDDLGAFLMLGTKMGRGAAVTVEYWLYNNVTLNAGAGPTMSDSVALFHANHANLNPGGAGAPSQALIEAMLEAMMVQTGIGEDGAKVTVGAPPRFFLAKPSLAVKINAILQGDRDPGVTPALRQPQPERLRNARAIEVPQLKLQAPGNDWYGVADQGEAPSYEIGFLNGNRNPRTQTVVGGRVDGTEVIVDLDFAIFPTGGWQGIARNAG